MRGLTSGLSALVLAAALGWSAAPQPVAAAATVAATAETQAPRLVPRRDFFGNPTRTQARISPDGKWMSFIAPHQGVMNIWLAPAADPGAAKPVTAETIRPIRSHSWSPDSSMLLYVNDKGGDENFLLYGVVAATGEHKLLTPFEKARVQLVGASPRVPGRILVGVNNRDPRWHDVHSLDLKTGELTLVFQNDAYAGFVADDNLVLRVALRPTREGGQQLHRVTDGKVEAEPFDVIGFEDSQTTRPLGFTADGSTLYWLDSRGRDTAALVAQTWATGERKVLGSNPRADVGGALSNPRTGVIEAYSTEYLRNDWVALDKAVGADLKFLREQLKGDVYVTSRTFADDVWIVSVDSVTQPPAAWRFDRKGRKLTRLFVTRPELEGAPLSPMHPREIRSRDGLVQTAYLTLPHGTDADGDGVPDKPVPLVLLVHGGPWARDSYGYNSYHQWLANRGYAVLSTNFRGSTGFGKAFVSAGDGEWGRKMHDDLLDAVDWAVKQGVTTPERVAIMGGSYGGYATLAGLAFTPDRFACGVDIVGPSNLETLLGSIPPYWESFRRQLYARMGDPGTPEGLAWLKERSPLYAASNIRRPLLIGQGANDPRVAQAESDQIVTAMRTHGIPVTYVLFPDEGHGFARPENNIAFNAVAEEFLAGCLKGRAEPIGDALKPSTLQVPYGAQYLPGLKAALDAR